MKNLRIVIVVVICAVVVLSGSLVTGGCAPKGPVTEVWEFPMLLPMSGAGGPYGTEIGWSISQAEKDINAGGGISGKPVSIPIINAPFENPDKVGEMFVKAAEGNLAVIGPIDSSGAQVCAPRSRDIGILYFTGSTTYYENTATWAPWCYNFFAQSLDNYKPVFNEYLNLLEGDVNSVAFFFHPESESYWAVPKDWMATAEKQGIEANPIEVLFTVVDFRAVVTKAVATGADTFINYVTPGASVAILKELKGLGVDPSRILNAGYNFSDSLFEMGGEDLDGSYLTDQYDATYQGEKWLRFLDQFRSETGKTWPQNVSRCYYDSVWMLKDAIEEMGITGDPAKLAEERKAIRDWIFAMDGWEGLTYKNTAYAYGGDWLPTYIYIMRGSEPELVVGDIKVPVPEEYR